MWDCVSDLTATGYLHLSHDMPCPRCLHAPHVYLPCDDCDCRTMRPGAIGAPGADEPIGAVATT